MLAACRAAKARPAVVATPWRRSMITVTPNKADTDKIPGLVETIDRSKGVPPPPPSAANKAKAAAAAGSGGASSSSSSSSGGAAHPSGGSSWTTVAAVAVGSGALLYVGGLAVSTVNESFRKQFETHVPLASTLLGAIAPPPPPPAPKKKKAVAEPTVPAAVAEPTVVAPPAPEPSVETPVAEEPAVPEPQAEISDEAAALDAVHATEEVAAVEEAAAPAPEAAETSDAAVVDAALEVIHAFQEISKAPEEEETAAAAAPPAAETVPVPEVEAEPSPTEETAAPVPAATAEELSEEEVREPSSAAFEDLATSATSTIDSVNSLLNAIATAEPTEQEVVEAEDNNGEGESKPTTQPTDEVLQNEIVTAVKAQVLEDVQSKIVHLQKQLVELVQANEASLNAAQQKLIAELKKQALELSAKHKDDLQSNLSAQKNYYQGKLQEILDAQTQRAKQLFDQHKLLLLGEERASRLAIVSGLAADVAGLEKILHEQMELQREHTALHRLVVALDATEDAVAARASFAQPLEALRSALADSNLTVAALCVDTIKDDIAQHGVATISELRQRFVDVKKSVSKASFVGEDGGMWSHAASTVLSYFSIKPTSYVEGDDVQAILARADYFLLHSDLDGAAREVNELKGWQRRLANDWLVAVREHLEVRQALDVVTAEASLALLNSK